MTIKTVGNRIQKALADRRVTDAEMKGILEAANPKVSNGEAKKLNDLHHVLTTRPNPPPGAAICFPTTAEAGAVKRLEEFAKAKSLPIGPNEKATRDSINDFLARARLGPPASALPRGLSRLMAVPLNEAIPGGPYRVAYVDVAKKTFTLVVGQALPQAKPQVWEGLGLPG